MRYVLANYPFLCTPKSCYKHKHLALLVHVPLFSARTVGIKNRDVIVQNQIQANA